MQTQDINILAIEAAAKTAGAAVLSKGEILAEQSTNGALTHSETLMPMVRRTVEASGLWKEDLHLIAVTVGPGSFTGLRIGAATAKGLAFALAVPIMPLCTLEVLAYGAAGFSGLLIPMMDARRSQVYAAIYRTEGGRLVCEREPEAAPAEALCDAVRGRTEDVLLLGDASLLYMDRFRDRLGAQRVRIAPAHIRQLRASSSAALALLKFSEGVSPVPSDQLKIAYLRKPQAEREREARLSRKGEADA